MWERWQKADTLHQIAQLFDRHHGSIAHILGARGGIRPVPRCRSRRALTLAEREEISRAVVAGHSMRSIAAKLGRAPSTVSREIKRNGGQESYRANSCGCEHTYSRCAFQRSVRHRHSLPSSAAVKALTATAATSAVISTPHTPMAIASARARSDWGARSP
jgi:DNA-binding CsgD family transcriptional regulator